MLFIDCPRSNLVMKKELTQNNNTLQRIWKGNFLLENVYLRDRKNTLAFVLLCKELHLVIYQLLFRINSFLTFIENTQTPKFRR